MLFDEVPVSPIPEPLDQVVEALNVSVFDQVLLVLFEVVELLVDPPDREVTVVLV